MEITIKTACYDCNLLTSGSRKKHDFSIAEHSRKVPRRKEFNTRNDERVINTETCSVIEKSSVLMLPPSDPITTTTQ